MNNPEQDKRGGWTSASSAAADDLCEGRHLAQKGLPEIKSGDSDFGTAIHEALAKQDPSALKPEELTVYEQCNELTTRMVEQFFGNDAPNVKVSRERRLWCSVLANPGDRSPKPTRFRHSGQVDYIARLGKRALIIDYKCLPGDVEASPTNKQTRDQVVLASGELIISEVGAVIVQPLVTMEPKICLYTQESIKQAEQEMFARVRRSNNPKAKRTPGEVQCKFCVARHICKERAQWVTSLIPKADVIGATPVKEWSPEIRTHFMNIKPVIQQWLDESYAELKRLMKEGPDDDFVPGYKLKDGNTVNTINDPQELFNRLVVMGKEWAEKEAPDMHADHTLLPHYMKCVKVVNKELEALVRKVTGLKGVALNKQIEKLREGIVDSSKNDQSITKDK